MFGALFSLLLVLTIVSLVEAFVNCPQSLVSSFGKNPQHRVALLRGVRTSAWLTSSKLAYSSVTVPDFPMQAGLLYGVGNVRAASFYWPSLQLREASSLLSTGSLYKAAKFGRNNFLYPCGRLPGDGHYERRKMVRQPGASQ
jgi:hypothetical protein